MQANAGTESLAGRHSEPGTKNIDLKSKLVDNGPKSVMANRAHMEYVRNSAYPPSEEEDVEFLAALIDQMFTLLTTMRDVHKLSLLEDERRTGLPQHTHEIVGELGRISDLKTASVEQEQLNPAKTIAGVAYTVVNDAVTSLVEYAAQAWKESTYQAEEINSVQISVPAFTKPSGPQHPDASAEEVRISMLAMTYNNHKSAAARFSSRNRFDDQQYRRRDTRPARSASDSALAARRVLADLDRAEHGSDCDVRRRPSSVGSEAMLGAGAAGLVLARMLFTRKMRLSIRV